MEATTGFSPTLTLLLAIGSLFGVVVTPIVVAWIGRGKSRSVTPEIERLTEVVADVDEELAHAHRREKDLRRERDQLFERAVRAEALLAAHDIELPEEG